jgi:hypothetical protein
MNASLIKDCFTYFAKYPLKAGVLNNFTKSSSEYFSGYDTLLAAITALTPHSLITNLNEYIFGSDLVSVIKRVEHCDGIYLFVDYGNIYDNLLEPMKTEQGEFTIAIIVARKTQPDDIDAVEQVLLSDITLAMISSLKDTAKVDANSNHFLKYLTFPTDLSPFFARDLFNSVGWTMTFRTKGFHLI